MDSQSLAGGDESVGDRHPGRRELRLALGMRGGVSLAVWMGGACAEIDAMRLAAESAGGAAPFYGPILEAAGFDGVSVDVMAGASAGGLNGALLASSLVYGVDFSAFREVWLKVGDVEQLLRGRKHAPAASVMRGDYFLTEMREQLGKQLDKRDRSRSAAEYVDLHLAVTATSARPVAVTDDSAAWYGEATHRAGFRFRHNRYTSDFVADPGQPASDEEAEGTVAKLAVAARASASFPGAFEPARVAMRRPDELGRRADPADPGELVGLFSDATRDVAWVIDGGVLDNIPVERAIQSIAEAPAERATERWLLYLCPSPDDLGIEGPLPGSSWDDDETAPHVIWTVQSLIRAFGSRESILEDMAVLRAHNDLADRYRAARDLLVGRLSGGGQAPGKPPTGAAASTADALLSAAAESSSVYERDRAARSASRVRALLEDPVETLGEDPFPDAPGWPLQGDGSGAWTRPRRERLEGALRTAFERRLAGAATAQDGAAAAPLGPFPVARAARLLIGDIRACEARLPDAVVREQLGSLKEGLYGLLDAAGLLSHLGELFWPVYLSTHPLDGRTTDLTTWAEDAVQAREAFLAGAHREETLVDEGVAQSFAWLRAELLRRLRSVDPDESWGRAESLVGWMWDQLDDRVRKVATRSADMADVSDDPDLLATVRVLRAIDDGDVNALSCAVALEVVTAPLSRISPVPPQPIRFTRLAGTNPTPLYRDFPKLKSDGRIDVRAKLAGNELANFAAFYKRAWRANDWMWGRLDAVGTLLHVLLQPRELGARLSAAGDGGERFLSALQHVVTAPLPAGEGLADVDEGAWSRHFADLWAKAEPAVRAEIVQLADPAQDTTGLDATVEVLTARRHWELLATELPNVLAEAEQDERAGRGGLLRRLPRRGRRGTDAAGQAVTPDDLRAAMGAYDVGRQTIADDLGSRRLTRLAARGVTGSWAALRLSLGPRMPHILKPVGPGLRVLGWSVQAFPPLRRLVGLGKRSR